MLSRMKLDGNSIRQSKINDAKILMENQLETDPSYNEYFVIWEHDVDAEDFVEQPIKLYNRKYSSANGYTVQFETLIGKTIPIGTVLYDTDEQIYYLCTESFNKDKILNNGKLTRCNNFLKWQDDSGKIFEYPVFDINSTQYNSGVQGDKVMTLGSTQHMLTITADENTIALDHDKRFFNDRNTKSPTVFKLTQNDTTALNYDKGLLHITITEDEYDPKTDLIENWLCDYIKPNSPTPIEIIYTGKPVIRIGGSAKTFTANTAEDVAWAIDDNFNGTVSVVSNGNTCKVKCAFNEDIVNQTFNLSCTDESGNIGTIEITITGGV
nr:MAG TPA: head closure knob [Caudoviricetes sp.]